MTKDPALKLPAQFSYVERGRLVLWIRDEYRERLLKQRIDRLDDLIAGAEGVRHFSGRSLVTSLEIMDGNGARMVIRSYFHGGWFGKINKDLFLGKWRPLRELIISEEAARRGIATTTVLAALSRCAFGPFYRSKLISKEIPGACDLIRYLQELKERPTGERLRLKAGLIRAVADMVRKMHDEGIYHADLHLKNVLVREEPPDYFAVYLIDFDKSWIQESVTVKNRIRNLMRFNRSAEKLKLKGLPITFSDQWRFLKEYFRDGGVIPSVVRRDVKRYLIRQEVHRWGWKLGSVFSVPVSRALSPRRSA